MAPLNPQVQQVPDPNYIYWSREIQQPMSDRSGQFSWTGAGEALDTAAKGVDYGIKQGIVSGLEKDLRPIEEARTQELQGVSDMLSGKSTEPSWAGLQKNLPPQLQSLPNQLDNLQSIRANGRISETHYIGQLYQVAKDYRDRFASPAYRELIDEQFHRITGIRPANAQIQSLLGDINSALGNKDKLKDEVVRDLQRLGAPPDLIEGVNNGSRPVHEGLLFTTSHNAFETQAKMYGTLVDTQEKDKKKIAMDSYGPAQRVISGLARLNLNDITATVTDPDTGRAANFNLSDLIKMAGTKDGVQLNDAQWAQMGHSATANLLATKAKINAWLDDPNQRADGRTWRDALGREQADKMVEDGLQLHKDYVDAIQRKDTGFMFENLERASAIARTGMPALMNDVNVRRQSMLMNFGRVMGGDNIWQWQSSWLTDNLATTPQISKELKDGVLKTLGQSPTDDVRPSMLKSNEPPRYTFSNQVDDIRKSRELSDDQKTIAAKALAEQPSALFEANRKGQIKDPAAIQYAKAVFGDPKSLENFNESYTGNDGRKRKGQTEYYQQWTSDDVSKDMLRLSAHDPQLLPMYKNWTERTGSRLFRESLGDLNDLGDLNYAKLEWHTDGDVPYIRAVPDFKPPKFPGQVMNMNWQNRNPEAAQANVDATVNSKLEGANAFLRSLAGVAKVTGEKDVNAYLLSTLRQNGVDLSKMGPAGTMVRDSIVHAHQFADEPKEQSLQDFLQNPSRASIPTPGKNNAPTASPRAPRGNLTDTNIATGQPIDIPEGVSPRDYIQQLRRAGKF